VWVTAPDAERGFEPLWHDEHGAPYVGAFRLHFVSGDAAWHADFPIGYFRGAAHAVATRLVDAGALERGEAFAYRIAAYVTGADAADPSPSEFTAVDQSPPLAVRDGGSPASRATPARADDAEAGDFDVFVPSHVLEEASDLTAHAGDVETGGILIGHIGRDPGAGDIFAEITALIPARHTVGDSTKLTFTSETWTDARAAVALRRENETFLGWFHSHPHDAWCREKGCPPERQRDCAAAQGFFSADDLALHRTMFPRAFTVALVMTRSITGIRPRLFGWRAGSFEPRGFQVLYATTATV
jgi:proteasome lid subunit RPN8/RPN11